MKPPPPFRTNRLFCAFYMCSLFGLASSNLQCEVPELIDNPIEQSILDLNLETNSLNEISGLDSKFFIQEPISPSDIQIPMPKLDPLPHKSSFLATSLSLLLPGLGHMYLGDLKTGGGIMSTTGLSVGGAVALHNNIAGVTACMITAQSAWMYGLYSVYRDVRVYNGQAGYSYKMAQDNFVDLTTAPFNWKVLKKFEVWGGVVGSLAVLMGASYVAFPKNAPSSSSSMSLKRNFTPLISFPVGLGEETFFRGFLQPMLSEKITPWGGIVLSSLLFGAAHIPNALMLPPENRKGYYSVILPLFTGFGVYSGWLAYKNQSLKESVALHTWYDFIVFTLASVAGQAAIGEEMNFNILLPF